MTAVDCNGKELKEGDTIQLIQDLKIKNGGNIKRGTVVKKIRYSDEEGYIVGKVDGSQINLKTEFIKKKK